MRAFVPLVGLIIMSINNSPSFADEGMWLYEMPPNQILMQEYSFELTPEKIEKLKGASVRLNNGGSGSFVSPDGLVLTNHHVALDALDQLSDKNNNYVEEGFNKVENGKRVELKVPSLELNVLDSIQDVTADVESVVQPTASASDNFKARQIKIAEIEADCLAKTKLRGDVMAFFDGARYHLYRYKKFTDVRVVFAPENVIGFFGGDKDNFEFPRYNLDMTLLRVYENNQPYQPKHYLKWSSTGTQKGDLTIVSGHPGGTSRHLTVTELVYERDIAVAKTIKLLEKFIQDAEEYAQRGDEQKRQIQPYKFSFENSLKVYKGFEPFLQSSFIDDKKKEEAAELAADQNVPGQPLKKALDQISQGLKTQEQMLETYRLFENFREDRVLSTWTQAFGGYSGKYFMAARHILRMKQEDQKPDAQRLREYQDSRRASLELELFSEAEIYPEMEKFTLTKGLETLVANLGANNVNVQAVLGGKTPVEKAEELVAGSKLNQVEERKRLAALSLEDLKNESDSFVQLAILVDPYSRQLRKQYEEDVEAYKAEGRVLLGKRHLADTTKTHYPDATFSLRFSFGKVEGFEQEGQYIEPFTTTQGIFPHAAAQPGNKDFALPQSWLSKKAVLADVPFNLTTTNDITGGNSGSPMVDRNLELIGLVFDGNRYSFDSEYRFNGEQNRTVAVDVRGMTEILRTIYGADDLLKSLGVVVPLKP